MPPPGPCLALACGAAGANEREGAAQDHRFLMQHGVEAFREL